MSSMSTCLVAQSLATSQRDRLVPTVPDPDINADILINSSIGIDEQPASFHAAHDAGQHHPIGGGGS